MKTIKGVCIVFILIIGLLLSGCGRKSKVESESQETVSKPEAPSQQTSEVDPSDYFPMDIGREWTYNIKLGKVSPMILEDVIIAKDNKPYNFSHVGPINVSAGNYRLKMRVVEPYSEELRSLGGVGVEILEDELGFYRFVSQIFWRRESPTFIGSQTSILQSLIYSDSELMSVYPYPQLEDADSIHSYRTIFIWGGGGIEQEDEEESFFFIDVDKNVPGWQGVPCYHFTREAKSDESTGSESITEDYWYAPKKGLVRLEQRVKGEISMTWTLK